MVGKEGSGLEAALCGTWLRVRIRKKKWNYSKEREAVLWESTKVIGGRMKSVEEEVSNKHIKLDTAQAV